MTPASSMVTRAILLICSVDLPAHALVTNMKQWNGANGCLYCEDEGTTIGADHLHRYWPYKQDCIPRTHVSLFENAKSAIRSGTAVSNKVQSISTMLTSRYVVSRVQLCWAFTQPLMLCRG